MIINTGGRDVVIDKVSVEAKKWYGQCNTKVYYESTSASISADLDM